MGPLDYVDACGYKLDIKGVEFCLWINDQVIIQALDSMGNIYVHKKWKHTFWLQCQYQTIDKDWGHCLGQFWSWSVASYKHSSSIVKYFAIAWLPDIIYIVVVVFMVLVQKQVFVFLFNCSSFLVPSQELSWKDDEMNGIIKYFKNPSWNTYIPTSRWSLLGDKRTWLLIL